MRIGGGELFWSNPRIYLVFMLVCGPFFGVLAQEDTASSGFGTISLQGLDKSKALIVDDTNYGLIGLLGPLVLPSGPHDFQVGEKGVPIRVVLFDGQYIELASRFGLKDSPGLVSKSDDLSWSMLSAPSKRTSGLLLSSTGALSLLVAAVMGYSARDIAGQTADARKARC